MSMVLVMFMICAAIPVSVTGAILINNLQRNSAAQRERLLTQLNEQITNALDMISEEIQGLWAIHSENWDVLRVLRKEYGKHDSEYVDDYRLMADLIGVCMQTNSKIYRMAFISRNGNVFTRFSPPYIEGHSLLNKRLREFEDYGREFVIFPPTALDGKYGEDYYIPYVLRLRDPHTWVTVGYLIVDMKYSMIERLLDNGKIDDRTSAHVMIVSGEDIVYSSSKKETSDERFMGKIYKFLADGASSGQIEVDLDGAAAGTYTVSTWHHDGTGWDVVTYASDEDTISAFYKDTMDYILLITAVMIFTWLVSRVIFKKFVHSVRMLQNAMLRAREGRLEKLDETYPNTHELLILYKSYNEMVGQMSESIQREYELKMLQKKTEMDMLLSQINPHFIYNTLSLIRAVVRVNELGRANEIIMCLSSMLRYSSKHEQFVSLRDELKQICNYLTIQSLRFPDTIHTNINMPDDILDCRVIKFILQPIVENAFKHGLEPIKNNRRLKITAECIQTDIKITISDNGIGMEKERLRTLQSAMDCVTYDRQDKAQPSDIGIGLLNVHKRLCYTYGPNYGIRINSEQGQGTKVVITIPLLERDGDIDEDIGR